MRKNIFLQLILCLIISSCTKNDSDVKTEYFQEGLTWLPENPDADSELTINFKASTKSKLYGYTGDVYVHMFMYILELCQKMFGPLFLPNGTRT